MSLIVYGRRTPFDSCGLSLDLYPDYANRDYVLREFDMTTKQRDFSLNRCSVQADGFLPETIKLGGHTPGEEDDFEK